ncbi:unnamed protein product, partial [Allacma fusca]
MAFTSQFVPLWGSKATSIFITSTQILQM